MLRRPRLNHGPRPIASEFEHDEPPLETSERARPIGEETKSLYGMTDDNGRLTQGGGGATVGSGSESSGE
jgi:hypothetical protein